MNFIISIAEKKFGLKEIPGKRPGLMLKGLHQCVSNAHSFWH